MARRPLKSSARAPTRASRRLADDLFREMAAAVMLETFFGRTLEASGVDVSDIARMIAFGSEYAFMPEQGRTALAPDRLRSFLDVRAKVLRGPRLISHR